MNRRLPSLTAALAWACAGLSLASVAAGCHKHFVADPCHDCGDQKCGKCKKCLCDPCADVPKGAIPLPAGTYNRTQTSREAAKAEADDFVIYWNEFQENSTKLGPFGSAHLLAIARRLPTAPYPVVIQPEKGDPELNRLRRVEVVNFLTNAGVANATDRVLLARPGAEGLFGEEAERIYPQLIQGGFAGGGGGGGAGFSGYGSFSGFGNFGGLGRGGNFVGGGSFGGMGGFGYR